ncbi:ester cyclase [Ferrimicrobium sp.]|uniref:ester cyclase n=1 Tax=Ferrimicrobium sp. TaxID=2926050 RepID=UPI0026053D57|nr:ester cyclase [Ferrimicrobium sp.]
METRGLIELFYSELWNEWNDALVDRLLTPNFEFRGSLGQVTHTRDEWRGYRDIIHAGSFDFYNEVVTLVCDQENGAARMLYRGTHSGPLLGIGATGKKFAYAGAAFFRADADRLTSAWVLGDIAALRAQLT